MFTERKMEEAIEWLFDLFEPEDYEAYDEEEMGRTGGLYLPEVCIALRDRAESIYEYTVDSLREQGFDYRGKELFDKRGCMIMSQVDQAAIGEEEIFYNTELWLMEDMTFVIVRCVSNHSTISGLMSRLEMPFCGFGADLNLVIIFME